MNVKENMSHKYQWTSFGLKKGLVKRVELEE